MTTRSETTTIALLQKGLVGIGIGLALVVSERAGWMSFVRGGIEVLLAPSVRSIGRGVSLIRSGREMVSLVVTDQHRVGDLERQNASLSMQLAEMVNRQKEQGAIGDLVEHAPELFTRFDVRPVRVVSAGRSFLLSNNGLREGDVVVSPEGAFVGVVDRLGRWTAHVRLVSDHQTRLPVVVATRDQRRVEGDVVGALSGTVTLERVLTDVQLSEDMMVITRGSDDVVPNGLLIGWVGEHVEKKEEAVYQSIDVTLAVKTEELSAALILSPKP